MKVAIIHDFLTQIGGAEKVLRTIAEIFPKSKVFFLVKEKRFDNYLKNEQATSFLRYFPFKNYRLLLPFLPIAAEALDLSEFDLVISSSSAFSKSVITRSKTLHLCYCHAPTRYLWDWHHQYLLENRIGRFKKIFLVPLLNYLRVLDRLSADRVDFFIANSYFTKRRIKKYYGRDSKVIYPPVEVDKFKIGKRGDYFLIVSRLSPYKRVDIAVEAFNKLELPLVIIGKGREKRRLEKLAGPTIKFKGFLKDEKTRKYLENCRAFVFPGEDDFGITMVEAMAAGKPVIAFRGGGALEIVKEGVSGEFFDEPMEEFLAEAIGRFIRNEKKFNPEIIRKEAEKFSYRKFISEFKSFVQEKTKKAPLARPLLDEGNKQRNDIRDKKSDKIQSSNENKNVNDSF